MSDLKKQLIRLGSTNPELRPHIKEVLAATNKRAMKFGPQTLEKKYEDMLQKIAGGLRNNHEVEDGLVIAMGRDESISVNSIVTTVAVKSWVGGSYPSELKVALRVDWGKAAITGKVGNKNIFPVRIGLKDDFTKLGNKLWKSVLEAAKDSVLG